MLVHQHLCCNICDNVGVAKLRGWDSAFEVQLHMQVALHWRASNNVSASARLQICYKDVSRSPQLPFQAHLALKSLHSGRACLDRLNPVCKSPTWTKCFCAHNTWIVIITLACELLLSRTQPHAWLLLVCSELLLLVDCLPLVYTCGGYHHGMAMARRCAMTAPAGNLNAASPHLLPHSQLI